MNFDLYFGDLEPLNGLVLTTLTQPVRHPGQAALWHDECSAMLRLLLAPGTSLDIWAQPTTRQRPVFPG